MGAYAVAITATLGDSLSPAAPAARQGGARYAREPGAHRASGGAASAVCARCAAGASRLDTCLRKPHGKHAFIGRLTDEHVRARRAQAKEAAAHYVGILDALLDKGIANSRSGLAVLIVQHDHLIALDGSLEKVNFAWEVVARLVEIGNVVMVRSIAVALLEVLKRPDIKYENVALRGSR